MGNSLITYQLCACIRFWFSEVIFLHFIFYLASKNKRDCKFKESIVSSKTLPQYLAGQTEENH